MVYNSFLCSRQFTSSQRGHDPVPHNPHKYANESMTTQAVDMVLSNNSSTNPRKSNRARAVASSRNIASSPHGSVLSQTSDWQCAVTNIRLAVCCHKHQTRRRERYHARYHGAHNNFLYRTKLWGI